MGDTSRSAERRVVFISHANPQDNDIVLWLASRLTCAGYLVWSDLTNLFGGDVFWTEIEDAIRHHTAKFVPLVSRGSQQASGVLDETYAALQVEKKERIKRFVVPLRVDPTPYGEFPANLVRKKAIDFSADWASGLADLLALLQEDATPCDARAIPARVSGWQDARSGSLFSVAEEEQELASNWIQIASIPNQLNFSRCAAPARLAQSLLKELPYPAFLYKGMYGSFADSGALQSGVPDWFPLTRGPQLATADFLAGRVEQLPELAWLDAQKMLSGLFKDAWERLMTERGLRAFEMASGEKAWYYPASGPGLGRVPFTDLDGRVRRKQILGRSKSRNAYWHFAVNVRPVVGAAPRLLAYAHVVFTRDGVVPSISARQMHTLRRGYCRNWWNDDWRCLMEAFLTRIAGSDGHIQLQLAPEVTSTVHGAPIRFVSPVTLRQISDRASSGDGSEGGGSEVGEDLDALLAEVELQPDASAEQLGGNYPAGEADA